MTYKKGYLFILMFSLTFIFLIEMSLAQQNITLEVQIIPKGVLTTEYNVVGDIFVYNITLYNYNPEIIEDKISVNITNLNHPSIDQVSLDYPIKIDPYASFEIFPYKNSAEKKDTYIWLFDTAGDYEIEICSSDIRTVFIKKYDRSYYYMPHCFKEYFSAMPKWQYELFKNQSLLTNNELTFLQDSNTILGRMDSSSDKMYFVAIVALFVSILNIIIILSNEQNRRDFKTALGFIITIAFKVIVTIIITLIIITAILFLIFRIF